MNLQIFFVNENHKVNFQKLVRKFQKTSSEYKAACYIAAYPEVFKCFKFEKQEHGPFDWYFDFLHDPDDFFTRRDRGETSGNPAPLTGQTQRLVELALNLWNGRQFDLSDGLATWDQELYLVAFHAMELRRSEPAFALQ